MLTEVETKKKKDHFHGRQHHFCFRTGYINVTTEETERGIFWQNDAKR